MSQEILQSVDSKRSEFTAGNELAKTARHYAPGTPSAPLGASHATVYDITTIDETSQFKAGSVATHRMPSQHMVSDSFMVVKMNAPSAGTTSKHVGLNVVSRLVVRNGNTVQEINDYKAVMSFILSRLSPSERTLLLSKVGGLSSADEVIIVPLPVFWSPIYTGTRCANNIALPLSSLNAPLELEITLATGAKLLASGGTFAGEPYSSVKFVHLLRKVSPAVANAVKNNAWSLWSYDYQTHKDVSLPDASTTVIDLSSFDGSSAGLFLNPVLASNVAVNDYYTIADAIGRYETFLNGSSHLKVSDNVASDSRLITSYLSFNFGTTSGEDSGDGSFSHNTVVIPFGGSLEAGTGKSGDVQAVFESYANLRDFTKIDLHLYNSNGADVITNVLNIRYASYYIADGYLNRRK